jgi:hypothetical protein
MSHYCRLGPGCDVAAWKAGSIYRIKFGSALADSGSDACLETQCIGLFGETLAALKRAGFRVPAAVFQRIDREVNEAEAARAEEASRQANLFDSPRLTLV